jgi:FixJ family two-component response regulator
MGAAGELEGAHAVLRRGARPVLTAGTIYVVDDDELVRVALDSLLRSVGYTVRLFPNAAVFLAEASTEQPACLILDIRLPGLSGLELQTALPGHLPVILVSGFGDIRMSVRGIKAGAVDFLEKPFRDQEMLDVVALALKSWRSPPSNARASDSLRARYGTLTPREREVMGLVCAGRMNKQIAAALFIQQTTVKFHRSSAMQKMGAKSVAELTRMAAILESDG